MNRQRAFTAIESLAMMATILVLTLILAAIMRQRKMWPFYELDGWLASRKHIEKTVK